MELLKAEINRKRKATEELIKAVNPLSSGTARFFRQRDARQLEENRRKEMQLSLNTQKTKQDADDALDNASRIGSVAAAADDNTRRLNDLSSLTVQQIKYRLRALGQPVTLFGESDHDRVNRLIQVQNNEVQDDEFRLGSGHNVPNSFLKHKGMNGDEDGDVAEEDDDEDDEDYDDINKSNIAGNNNSISEPVKRPVFGEILFSKIQGMSKEKVIYKYFRNLLKIWEWDLNARDDKEKLTSKGKQETKTQKQCKDYIRPLFKLCKKKDVPEDILEKLHQIVTFCEDGNFRAAHDMYLRAAIGNSAWPIGLTMVGIHERSGREKISTSKVAHVMNNECQRKYFTSVKRLMTFAQHKSPHVPPSMKVL